MLSEIFLLFYTSLHQVSLSRIANLFSLSSSNNMSWTQNLNRFSFHMCFGLNCRVFSALSVLILKCNPGYFHLSAIFFPLRMYPILSSISGNVFRALFMSLKKAYFTPSLDLLPNSPNLPRKHQQFYGKLLRFKQIGSKYEVYFQTWKLWTSWKIPLDQK